VTQTILKWARDSFFELDFTGCEEKRSALNQWKINDVDDSSHQQVHLKWEEGCFFELDYRMRRKETGTKGL
jgi:hypothetical protein